MASTANSLHCELCCTQVDTYQCTQCGKIFCFVHLQLHREETRQKLLYIQDNLNNIREKVNRLKQYCEDDPLQQQSGQWEQGSVTNTTQVARDARQRPKQYLAPYVFYMEGSLNDLVADIKRLSEKNNFDETHVKEWSDKLNELGKQIDQLEAVAIRQASTPLMHALGFCIYHPPPNTRWVSNGVTVAGGHGKGSGTSQLSNPLGLTVDEEDTMFIADLLNNRIVAWKRGTTLGEVVAGGHGQGNGLRELNCPVDVLVDRETDSLLICDRDNRRVMRWSRRSGTTHGEMILDNIYCRGLTMDDQRSLYVTDTLKHEVRCYRLGDTKGILVAGGNGQGDGLHQLNFPAYISVDLEQSVYVSDTGNHRVMKWMKGATQGTVVAGGAGEGSDRAQLSDPRGLLVDAIGTVYVSDYNNDRVMRWCKGAKVGSVVMGGNGSGNQANQLNGPIGLSFDRYGHLYVVENENHRVQRFSIEKTN